MSTPDSSTLPSELDVLFSIGVTLVLKSSTFVDSWSRFFRHRALRSLIDPTHPSCHGLDRSLQPPRSHLPTWEPSRAEPSGRAVGRLVVGLLGSACSAPMEWNQ